MRHYAVFGWGIFLTIVIGYIVAHLLFNLFGHVSVLH